MTDGLVQIAYLHPHTVSHSWHESMMRLVAHDAAHHGRVLNTAGPYMIRCDSGGLVESRNLAVQRFLDETEHEWLWFIDTDMGFEPNTVDRLLDAADPVERPVVGALCFGLRENAYDGMGGRRAIPVPTLYTWARTPKGEFGFTNRWAYPPNTLVQVAGTGAACLLIHRTALEKIRGEHGDMWFDQVRYGDGRPVSEDLSFCYRLNGVGVPVFVHTGVKTTHHKQIFVAEQDYQKLIPPPPATEPVAVIVPVMKRPQNAAPFMASLRASTGLATVHVLADALDLETKDAWRAASADHVHTGTLETFARKVNEGYRVSDEPWLFLVGDDVRFHPGWLDHAQAVAGSQFHVIGTNDLANPRVMAGEHATHVLVRRSYVDEYGASWDGPKVVCHEGYRHWYVDDEIVTAAKQRGVWAMASGAVVEHRNPMFSGAPTDEVYELAKAASTQDYAHHRQRLATYAPELAHA